MFVGVCEIMTDVSIFHYVCWGGRVGDMELSIQWSLSRSA